MTEKEIMDTIGLLEQHWPLFIEWGLRLFSAAFIVIAGWMLGNMAHKKVAAIKKLDATLRSFLGGFIKYIILAVAVITVLGQFGVQTASLLAVLGAAGLAIGLAMQGTLSNVAAGVMILILRPFNIGDFIMADSTAGTVQSLGLFGTELATPDNVYIFVPNSKIWNTNILNYSRNPIRRQDINVGISYGDDIGKAYSIITKVLNDEERTLKSDEEKLPQVMASGMSDFSVDLIVRFWCKKEDFWSVKWALTKNIKEALDKGGITIPFPTRTLHMVDSSGKKKAAA